MGARPWLILGAVALARIGFGYQYQTVATLGPDLMQLYRLDYAGLGTLIGAFMLLGGFLALPLGILARRLGDRLVLGAGLALMGWPGGQRGCRRPGRDRRRPQRGWGRRGGHDRVTEQDHCRLVHRTPVHVGDQVRSPPTRSAWASRSLCCRRWRRWWLARRLFVRRVPGPPRWRCSWPASGPRRMRHPSPRSSHAGWRECLLLVIAGLTWTAYTAGYSAYTVCSVPHGGAGRKAGVDWPGSDDCHLGQRACDAAWRWPRRALRRLSHIPLGTLSLVSE